MRIVSHIMYVLAFTDTYSTYIYIHFHILIAMNAVFYSFSPDRTILGIYESYTFIIRSEITLPLFGATRKLRPTG